MEERWKNNLRDKLSDYSEPAPEGLFDEVMAACGTDIRRRRYRILAALLSGTAAAAAVVLSIVLNRPAAESGDIAIDRGPVLADIVTETADDGNGSIAPETGIPVGPEAEEGFPVMEGSTDREEMTVVPEDEPESREDEEETDIVLEPEEKATGMPVMEKEEKADMAEKDDYSWQDILIAEAGRPRKERGGGRPSVSIHASGFAGGSDRHSGYSRTVATMAAAAPMAYGDNALAGIMMFNRSKEINTDTRHYLPVRAGVSVSYGFTPRWNIETGIVYSYLLSTSRSGSDSYYIDSRQTLHYLGIPVYLSYDIWKNRWLRTYLSAGGMVEKCISGSVRQNYFYGNEHRNTETDRLAAGPLQWSVAASAGLQFSISPLVGIYLEPGLTYHFDNGSDVATVYSEQPLNFNLNLGLRFSL